MGLQLTFPAEGGAFVFGGSGGAGSAICQMLAEAGTPVAFTYHRGKVRAEATEAEVRSRGQNCAIYQLDGADATAVEAAVNSAAEQFGGLHTVIYAGGPQIDFLPIADVPAHSFRSSIEAEVISVHNLVRAGVPHLRQSGGSFTACVTFAIRRVLDRDGLSAVPKAAIESMVRQVAAEEACHRVRANCVGLGWIDVGLGAAPGVSDNSLREAFGKEAMEALLQIIRLGRPGTGMELASAVLFFASQQASYLTGQTVMADGGATI
jgi:3-oxoacyl-[acyl-carrier protein] reductase